MQKTISVTERDIQWGKRHSAMYCPVARALARAGFKNVEVYPISYAYDSYRGDEWESLPMQVRTFVERYDAGESVEPFEFFVEVLYT